VMDQPKSYHRPRGEALHPEREPLDTLQQLRRSLGEYSFAGQYQQAPAPAGGGLVKTEWFRRYALNEKPEHFDRIIQSWDTANKASELSDYSVCTTWGVKGKDVFLLHVLRKQLEYPDLKRAVQDQQQLYSANVVLIEDRASGTQLIQELKAEKFYFVVPYKPSGDKVMRMHSQTAMIENGFVYLPTEAPWLPAYLHEMAVFPNGKYDDQVDSTAQALDWCKAPQMKGWAIFELHRRQYGSRLPHRRAIRVVVQAPPHIRTGHFQTISGVTIPFGPDGALEMSREDAKYYLGRGWTKIADIFPENT
jgi:predicted phage terminase large subunit-like protein